MKHLYLAAFLAISILSCQSPAPQETLVVQEAVASPVISGKFVHMVFFWLKPETDVKAFMAGTESFLKQVEVVNQYHLGVPAMTPREVVDNTYTVALVVTFDSKEAQDIYQDHPVHVQYVEANKDKWTRVQIYDSWAGE